MNEDFIRQYCSEVCGLLRRIDPGPMVYAITILYDAWKAGKPVLFCGNGGSGASCSHIVNDFQKNAGLKALCLNDSMPLVSAWANDSAWNDVFRPQIALWGQDGAVLVAVSGSGNSQNVLNAVAEARRIGGIRTIGLTGFDGGELKRWVSASLHVPTDSMQQAEDAHMVILHMLFLGLVERIKAGDNG